MVRYFELKLIKIPLPFKFFYKFLYIGFKIFLFVLGLSFITVKIPVFKLIGFWLILIYLSNFLFFKNKSPKNIKYEKSENVADFMDKSFKIFIFDIVKNIEILRLYSKTQLVLLLKLLDIPEIKDILVRLNIDLKNLKEEIRKNLSESDSLQKLDLELKPLKIIQNNLETIFIRAYEIAKEFNLEKITFSSVFLALSEKGNPIVLEILNKYKLIPEVLRPALVLEYYKKLFIKRRKLQPHSLFLKPIFRRRWLNRTWTSSPTPILDKLGIDLTYLAEIGELGFLVGHKKEVERVISLLEAVNNINFLFVGKEGIGRNAIIWHLAYLITKDQVPEKFYDYRLIQINIQDIFALEPQEFLTNFQSILNEAIIARNVILYIPEIHNIFFIPELSACWPLIVKYMKVSNLNLIATITKEGFSKLEGIYNFGNIFEIIEVEELSIEEAITLLTLEAVIWENEYKVIISPQAISKAVILAKKFLIHKPLPGSARDLLLEAIGFAKSINEKTILPEMIGDVFTKITGIPVKAPVETEKYILQNLEEIIHQRLVNQEFAVKEVARTLRMYRAGIEKKGPIAVFLFIGPTGVGKTELAKTLAKIYFGGEDQIIRLDMVEFQKPEDVEKLIGNEEKKIAGLLTEEVLRKPYSLILLDEFEKAHFEVLNIFLPIFDEGYIKDGFGRLVDFSNTIIICTSNALSDFIKEEIEKGKSIEAIAPILRDKLTEVFRIELLNRFSQIVIFRTLNKEDVSKIIDIIIRDLNGLLLQKFGLTIELTEKAKERIIELGFSPIYGAREVKRTIEREIMGPLSDMLLKEEIQNRNKILVDFEENFSFKPF